MCSVQPLRMEGPTRPNKLVGARALTLHHLMHGARRLYHARDAVSRTRASAKLLSKSRGCGGMEQLSRAPLCTAPRLRCDAYPLWLRLKFDRVEPRWNPGTRKVVGARGFEPPTPCAQGRCATRLRYAPTPHDTVTLRPRANRVRCVAAASSRPYKDRATPDCVFVVKSASCLRGWIWIDDVPPREQ
jgi:hypothetical protein